jgi:hypothetical protein
MRSWDGILCVEMWVRPPPASSVEHHIPCSSTPSPWRAPPSPPPRCVLVAAVVKVR